MSLNILGISSFYHDSACCLLMDGKLVAAAQEERFSRKKNDSGFPINALRFCLNEKSLSIKDIDCIAYYENPTLKLSRQLWSRNYSKEILRNDARFNPERPEEFIKDKLGFDGVIKYYQHHHSHASSSFYYSGFETAAIMTMDGVGEWATTAYAIGEKTRINTLHEVHYPDSIGLLYSAITSYLGFKINEGEYKVMGLAPYGAPKYKGKFEKLLKYGAGYDFELDMKYFDFLKGESMFSNHLCELFEVAAREPGAEITQFHMDMASSLQKVLEEFVVLKSTFLHKQTGIDNLCLAGGVALNCVANRAILDGGQFKKIFIPPGSNDSGCAIGAATLANLELNGSNNLDLNRIKHAYWGPKYDYDEIHKLILSSGLVFDDYEDDPQLLLKICAQLISQGKVLGWFQGRMEFGPRALGSRSILADPRNPNMKDLINSMVKKREGFRPFAPTVIEENAAEHFLIDHASPFMLETCPVISKIALPAVTHVDGSARLQTVDRTSNAKYYDLLIEFEKLTGCPILLNTSFNVNKEPIVCSPVDAIRGFIRSNIDVLVIENFIVERNKNNIDLVQYQILDNSSIDRGVIDTLYTFI